MRRSCLISLIALTLVVGDARGQRADSHAAKTETVSLARFVPVSTKVFVRVNNMREVDAAMKKAHAWRLLAMASGGDPSDAPDFDVRAVVGALLGGGSKVSTGALMRTQVALAARSWSELESAVWYLRVPSERTLNEWFPPGKRRDVRISPNARLIKMPNGVIACVCDGIVALGRRFEPESLLRETVRLMASRQATALSQDKTYQNLSAYLPGHPLATVYLVADSGHPDEDESGVPSVWDIFPDMTHVVVGMYEREGRIDLAVRGKRATPSASRSLSPRVLNRVRKLPHTTLFASATTIHVEDFLEKMHEGSTSNDTLSRYVRVLLSLRARAVGADVPLPPLGPSMIFAWDEDFRGETSTPQLALLIESSDARALASEVGQVSQRLIGFMRALDPVDPPDVPAVALDVHLGTAIAHASLRAYSKRSRFPIAKLLANVEFAWAAHDGWLILTLSRDHLERIIEANVGLAPTLATVRDAHSVWQLGGKRSAVALIQADAAAGAMEDWLAEAATGKPSLLNQTLFETGNSASTLQSLGIVFDATSVAGAIKIDSIRADSPATGKLRVGDQIVGLDGELLDIALPDRDFEKRWNLGGDTRDRVIRVRRDGEVIDVELDAAPSSTLVSSLARDLAASLQELVGVGHAIPFAGLSVFETDDEHYAAMMSLRFAGEENKADEVAP
jgi:hypothetical protein